MFEKAKERLSEATESVTAMASSLKSVMILAIVAVCISVMSLLTVVYRGHASK